MPLSNEPLISAAAIERRVDELAQTISNDLSGRDVLVVPILKGAVIFAADIFRRLRVTATLDFVRAKSYAGTSSAGTVEFTHLPEEPVTGKHVLIVEDILDTGRTVTALRERLAADSPDDVAVCALLDKPARRVVPRIMRICGIYRGKRVRGGIRTRL